MKKLSLFLILSACAKDPKTGQTCSAVSDVPKSLILQVGAPRANAMTIQYCNGCFVAKDNQGEVVICE